MINHFQVQTFCAASLAAKIKKAFHSEELGWTPLFGGGWEGAYNALRALPPDAIHQSTVINAIGVGLAIQIRQLCCASCARPVTQLINIGHTNASFMVCEACLAEAQAILEESP